MDTKSGLFFLRRKGNLFGGVSRGDRRVRRDGSIAWRLQKCPAKGSR